MRKISEYQESHSPLFTITYNAETIQTLPTLISALCRNNGNTSYANSPKIQIWGCLHHAQGKVCKECQDPKTKPYREFPGYNFSKQIIDLW